jgi:RNA polymerase-interacting CarD/CdnL/TRCF family regulator
MEKLLSWGITIGGYNNNFKLDKAPNEKEFTAIILKIMQKKEAENLYEWVPGSLETLSSNKILTTTNSLKLLLAAESQRVLEMDEKNYYQKALEMNLIPDKLIVVLTKDRIMKRKEMIILAAHYLELFETPSDLKDIRGEYFD